MHCAELWVETLVAQDTIATIGGRILVGPTTVLTADLAAAAISMWVKHNELAKDDTAYCESSGKVEFVRISPLTIGGVDVVNDWFLRNGDWRTYFTAGTKFTIAGSTGNNGEWTVESSSYSAPNTTIYVVEDITDATVDGHFLYWGEQGVGPYRYVIGRNIDGSGANDWYAGDAVFNTGNVGDGFIDLYSVHGIKAPTEYGPTIVGNVRNSTTFNDWSEHWAIGQLNGLYGYAATTYGLGLGKYSATSAYMTIDPTNGIRFYGNNVIMGQWQPGGDVIFGQVATNKANLFWDQSEGVLQFRGGTDGTATTVEIDTAGSLSIDAKSKTGAITLGDIASANSLRWIDPADDGWLFSIGTAIKTDATTDLRTHIVQYWNQATNAEIRIGFFAPTVWAGYLELAKLDTADATFITSGLGSFSINCGLNVGTTGAGTGDGFFSGRLRGITSTTANYHVTKVARKAPADNTFADLITVTTPQAGAQSAHRATCTGLLFVSALGNTSGGNNCYIARVYFVVIRMLANAALTVVLQQLGADIASGIAGTLTVSQKAGATTTSVTIEGKITYGDYSACVLGAHFVDFSVATQAEYLPTPATA